MTQRIKEFEEDCKRWRERFFSESKLGRPSSAMMREQPKLQLEGPDFPEFGSDWPADNARKSSLRSANMPAVDSPYQTFLEEDMDGNKILKLRFDIGDYNANEINVSVEGHTLFIKGDREVSHGNTSKSENFSKELTIPDYADKNHIKSSLTSDGFLIVQCPVHENRLKSSNNIRGFLSHPFSSHSKSRTESHSGYNATSSSVTRSQQPSGDSRTRFNDRTASPRWWSGDRRAPTVEQHVNWPTVQDQVTKDNTLVYKFGFPEFRLEDLNIQVKDKMVLLTAQKEEVETDGKVYKKYQREIKLPENANPANLRNGFTKDGVLTIEIPLTGSSVGDVRTNIASSDVSLGDNYQRRGQSDMHLRKDSQPFAAQNSLKLRYDLAMYSTDNIQVQVTGKILSIYAPFNNGGSDRSDFNQRYNLPDWADGTMARANVDKSGVLTIEIPRKS